MAGSMNVARIMCVAALVLLALLPPVGSVLAESMTPPLPSARTSAADPFTDFVAVAAQRFGIPAAWIRAVMRVESAGDVHAISPKGAMGLMQIMPETWSTLRVQLGLGTDPYDAHDNILAGAAYLREMYDRYGSPGFLAAYNAGPAAYEQYLATGRALPEETQRYLAVLTPTIGNRQPEDEIAAANSTADPRAWAQASLFVGSTNGLFVPISSAAGQP